MKLFITKMLILSVAIFLQACDLDLQRSYDFDEDARWEAPDPFEITIYEWMTQNEEFNLMVEAIERADMQNTFNGGEDDKTVLLLRTEAMEEFLDDYGYAAVADVPVETLQSMLNYHVIPTRLKQRDMNISRWHTFQTLIDGDDGLINLYVDGWWYWEIQINGEGAPDLPPTAKRTIVRFHNFEFTNGVGHQLINYVQRVPFE